MSIRADCVANAKQKGLISKNDISKIATLISERTLEIHTGLRALAFKVSARTLACLFLHPLRRSCLILK